MAYAPKICKECGKEFIPNSPRQDYCKDIHYRPCPICGKPVKVLELNKPPVCCSPKCRTIKKQGSTESRTCEICGKVFKAFGTQKYCSEPHYRPCPVCGKPVEFHRKSDPVQCCSTECKVLLRKQTIKSTERICKICGKVFVSEGNTALYCSDQHYRPCPICGKPVPFTYPSEPLTCCSPECSKKHREQTSIALYGVYPPTKSDIVRKKLHDISLSASVIASTKQTNMKKYGFANASQAPEIKKKIRTTLLSDSYKAKFTAKMQQLYGVDYAMQSVILKQKQSDTCKERYEVPYACMLSQCRENNHFIISNQNKRISELFNQYGVETSFEYKIGKHAYDLYLEQFNTLVEVNPTYTHNVIGNHWSKNGTDKYYHIEKSKLANSLGFKCIHIFDWDNPDKIALRFQHKKKVYARKCSIRTVDITKVNQFLNEYHLQGSCYGQKICLGLFYNDTLLQLMTFGNPRYNKNYQYELLRLCTSSDTIVVGGSERLFKHFLREYNPESVISYCDLAKFSGDVYERIGFKYSHSTEPNLVWSNGVNKITNNLLRQRGFDQLFNTNFGKGTDNEELMIQHGWLPVYDCGQGVYEYRK